MVKVDVVVIVVKQLVNLSTRLLTIFIVFSYRRLLDVICADRHWKLVYIWISAHITMLEEHPPISGSLMFLSWIIIREHPSDPCSTKGESKASSAWAAYVKRSTDAVRTVWGANRSCWQRRNIVPTNENKACLCFYNECSRYSVKPKKKLNLRNLRTKISLVVINKTFKTFKTKRF